MQENLTYIEAKKFAASLRFGDVVENFHASEDNPQRKGVFVTCCRYTSRRCMKFTDTKGKFWHIPISSQIRVKKYGNIINSELLNLFNEYTI